MRIRGRSLPFPPLFTSPLPPLSDPSASAPTSLLPPITDSAATDPTSALDRAAVKTQLLSLHPNAALQSTNSRASSTLSSPSSTSFSPAQFFLKKEESDEKKRGESFAESKLNAEVISIAKRATLTTNFQDKDLGKPADCTMMKNKQKESKAMLAKEKKTMRNSAVLLEGSRCSRVNGRGWRCCQPTLVGYLLCEHHLGKGRTRNMISNATRGQLGCTESKRNLFEGGSADEAARKKRNIVPTVKARSISSLLDDGAGH